MPEIHHAEPAYLQIARHLRDQITSGELTDGDLVPSARQLAGDWKVSAPTAVKALAVLSSEGLVVTRTGYGTVVQAPSLHRSARDHTVSVIKTGRIYPEGHYAKVGAADLVPAPESAAAALGVDAGAPVIRRLRTTFNASDTPLSTSVSWFDGGLADVAPLLLQTDRIIQGTARYIEEQTGRTRSLQERMYISAGSATAEEAAALGVPEGSSVLRTRNYYWDTEGDVIEYGEAAAAEGQETAIDYRIEETTT